MSGPDSSSSGAVGMDPKLGVQIPIGSKPNSNTNFGVNKPLEMKDNAWELYMRHMGRNSISLDIFLKYVSSTIIRYKNTSYQSSTGINSSYSIIFSFFQLDTRIE